jgi:tRNA (guanine-N7-)-methyltransferase
MVSHNGRPLDQATDDLYHDDSLDDVTRQTLAIQTYYEQMWMARGISIKYLRWRLPREGKLEEPGVEIPLDDYRSYHRTKRSSLDKAK